MNCSFPPAAMSCVRPYFWRQRDSIFLSRFFHEFQKTLFSKKIWQFFSIGLIVLIIPHFSYSQLDPGSIGSSQCINSGATPAAFTSVAASGIGYSILGYRWESSSSLAGPYTPVAGVAGLFLLANETYSPPATSTVIYYRRRSQAEDLFDIGTFSFPVSNVVYIGINPTFTPVFPPLPIICEGTTSFPVNFTTTGLPDQYNIIWDATAASAGFANVNPTFAANNLPATPGSFSVSVPGNVTGTYNGSLIVRVSLTGCSSSANASSVLINPLPTIGGTLNVCVGLTTSLIGSGTAAVVTPWTSSNTGVATVNNTGVVTGVSAGTAIITYTNDNGCQQTTTVTVNALPAIGGTLNVCVGSTTSLTGSGTPAVATPWTSSNTGVATVNSVGVVTGVSAGTTIITYTNNNGCQQTEIVTVNALPTIGGTLNVCVGSTTSLIGSGTAAVVTPWTSSNTGVATANSVGVVTGVSAGTTIITYTNNNGCQQTSTVTVNALPTISGTLNVCVGSTTSLIGSGTAAVVTPWTSSNTGVATVNSVGLVTGVSAGTTIITYTNNNGCQQTTTVTVNALPAIGGTLNVCVGLTTSLIGSGIAAASTPWVSSNTGIATINSIGIVTGVSIGTTIITYTNNNGCQQTVTATINPLPTALISGTTSRCQNASAPTITFTGSNATAPYTFTYNINGGPNQTIVSDGSGIATINAPTTTAGSFIYTLVSVAESSGTTCINTASGAATVTVNALPATTVNASGPITFCVGGSVNLTAGAGVSWLWNTGETSQTISVNSTSSKSVTITDANGCSATSGATSVTVNALPTAIITPGGATTFCSGGSVTLTASAGISWLWNTGETTQSVSVNNTASKSVTITDGNGCSATSSATAITVNALPTATITPGSPTTFCAGGSVNLTASAGSSWLWNTGETTQSVSVNNTASKSVRVTDGNGCSATSSATAITVNALPTATITPGSATTFCAGGSVNLTASAGSSWLWNTGETTQSVSVNNTASKSVRVTDGNGCSATSLATAVTVNALPTVTITPGSATTFCAGGSVNLTASTGDSWLWNTGETTQTISVNNTATKTVTVTNANGCSATSSATQVTAHALPAATVTAGGATTFCSGGTVNLTASSGTSWLWSTGETTQTISVNNTTTKTVTVTDANGCSATSSPTIITVNPLPNIIATNPAAICAPGTIDLTSNNIIAGSTAGLTYTYWRDAATALPVINPASINTSGIYYIKGTTTQGCTSVQSVNLTVNPKPGIVITDPSPVCSPATVDLTSPAVTSGSTAGTIVSYWTDATAIHPLIAPRTIAASGNYYIKGILPATGCSSIQPVTVTIKAPPNINIHNPAAVCEPVTVDLTLPGITSGSAAGTTFTYWSDAAKTVPVAKPDAVAVSGTYYIKGVIAATGCSASLPVIVSVNPLPDGSLQAPAVNYICDGTPLLLKASNAFAYQWYADQKIITGATDATYAATRSGNYTVRFISKEGCTKYAGNQIDLDLLTKPLLQFKPQSLCMETPINFTNSSNISASGGISWLWDFGDGSSSNNSSPVHTFKVPGKYAISLTANNASCPALTEKITIIHTIESAQEAVRYDTIHAVAGKPFVLTARLTGINYLWKPATGLNSAVVKSPIANISKDMDYTVAITSQAGCITIDSVYVKLAGDGEIHVAQGFTPNGDGVNDRAYPIPVGIRQLNYFKIFNRWGNLVFQTNDASPQNGWDGKFSGRLQPSGTYTWTAEGIDGKGNIIRRSGSVLLIN
jgi:gliding motility-associated-like protein